jgi:COMPASS component SWD2
LRIEAAFTPDSKYIISGSENGCIHFWDLEGNEIVKLEGHPKPVMNVKFNPKFAMLATACSNIILWLPKTYSD